MKKNLLALIICSILWGCKNDNVNNIPSPSGSGTGAVLCEIMTSTTCGPCASSNSFFDNWLENYSRKSQVSVIKYHVWWPSPGNDPYYAENIEENFARTTFYQPSSRYVPRCFVNGIDAQSSPAYWISLIEKGVEEKLNFEFKILTQIDQNNLSAPIDILILKKIPSVIPGSLKIYAAITESKLIYSGVNGDPVHNLVFRKFFPNINGQDLKNTFIDTTVRIDLNWNQKWKPENCKLVLFIQNYDTKEVLHSFFTDIIKK